VPGEAAVLETAASAREPVAGSWRAACYADGLASGIVQLATGADDDVGSDSGNCDTAAQHCKFFFNKVTTIESKRGRLLEMSTLS
jgi:hypothetical protein